MPDITSLDLKGLRVLVRLDLNVPTHNGHIVDYARINQTVPTIEFLRTKQAKIIIISHFGRPSGRLNSKLSLKFLVPELETIYKTKVYFQSNPNLENGEVLLLENLRFDKGEENNDSDFAKNLAKLADIYINDAFSCSHRPHASICKITEFLPSYPGFALKKELANLRQSLSKTLHPKVIIIAGLKVSTKFKVLTKLVDKVDYLFIGGAMANTFLHAIGHDMKLSYIETDFLEQSCNFYNSYKNNIILPIDLVCEVNGEVRAFDVDKLPQNAKALDIGPKSIEKFIGILKKAKLVIWNGPLGYYEDLRFAKASLDLACAITKIPRLQSIVGGGDTIAAVEKYSNKFTYLSSSGGAFLEWLENSDLPGLVALGV